MSSISRRSIRDSVGAPRPDRRFSSFSLGINVVAAAFFLSVARCRGRRHDFVISFRFAGKFAIQSGGGSEQLLLARGYRGMRRANDGSSRDRSDPRGPAERSIIGAARSRDDRNIGHVPCTRNIGSDREKSARMSAMNASATFPRRDDRFASGCRSRCRSRSRSLGHGTPTRIPSISQRGTPDSRAKKNLTSRLALAYVSYVTPDRPSIYRDRRTRAPATGCEIRSCRSIRRSPTLRDVT